jgi:hypothetical protein
MFIKIQYPLILESGPDACIVICIMILLLASGLIVSFNFRIENCRRSISFLSSNNMILNSSLLQCNIPYEECRCSVISNKFNNTIECITDIQVITAPISPLVSYVMQLYIIYKLFSFTEKSSHILRDICWVIALFGSIIIAIGARGSTCLYYRTSEFLFHSGICLYAIFLCLFILTDIKYRLRSGAYRGTGGRESARGA